ncbi:hypothetical protein PIB30_085032 [Stylosanthes scabra]|uniref:Uncharacterized protein n=1 Tax=Stylosanthes scabra TaxID=79078 RepID=A0ABU6VR69_9FABA|nr:hypothetical protein [Stylosanthes scabra]
MASSSALVTIFDEHRFWKEFNQQLFESHARRMKFIPKVGFNLDKGEYPQIMEQIMLRGWRRLAAPMTGVSKLLVQEFYTNAAVSDEEATNEDELPYKSFVRGIKVDFSPDNIQRVMRFKSATAGAETDYKTRQAIDQKLDVKPLTKGLTSHQCKGHTHTFHHEGRRSEGGGHHCRQHGSDSSRIAKQGEPWLSKHNLQIMQGCVPFREFRRTSKIPEEKYITAKRIESTRIPRNLPQQQQGDDDEDEPMPQVGGGNDEEEDKQQQNDFQ